MKPDIYEKIIQWAENIGSIASEELPTFIKEVAQYGFYEGIIAAVGWITVAIILLVICNKFYKKTKEKPKDSLDDPALWLIPALLFFVLSFLCGIGIIYNVSNSTKAIVAPRLYVLERFIKK